MNYELCILHYLFEFVLITKNLFSIMHYALPIMHFSSHIMHYALLRFVVLIELFNILSTSTP